MLGCLDHNKYRSQLDFNGREYIQIKWAKIISLLFFKEGKTLWVNNVENSRQFLILGAQLFKDFNLNAKHTYIYISSYIFTFQREIRLSNPQKDSVKYHTKKPEIQNPTSDVDIILAGNK